VNSAIKNLFTLKDLIGVQVKEEDKEK